MIGNHLLALLTAVSLGIALFIAFESEGTVPKQAFEDGWWAKGPRPSKELSEDTDLKNFHVNVSEAVLIDLKARLVNSRFTEDLEDGDFNMGFQVGILKEIVQYWREKYDWRKHEAEINHLDHFTTKIEGINLHFVHAKPSVITGETQTLLMIHGWPGSVWEFHKVLPRFTHPEKFGGNAADAVEVVCPSIPGYGWSEAPKRRGFDQVSAARIMHKLMERLGKGKYFVQGGDWGSIIVSNMARMYPQEIKGVHVNMFGGDSSLRAILNQMMESLMPSFFLSDIELAYHVPFWEKMKTLLFKESGYFHIQATKPDTVAIGLNDSPIGLASYILEKFCYWTNKKSLNHKDGMLTYLWDLDEVLTNVMIYWITQSIGSSQRFYKEMVDSELVKIIQKVPIKVPSGIAVYPSEVIRVSRRVASLTFHNILHFKYLPKGGHFAAFEEPDLFVGNLFQFINAEKELVNI